MPGWQRIHVTVCAGLIAWMLGYAGVDYARLPHPTYFPLEHEWRMAGRVAGLPSGYVGLWLWAWLFAALVAGALHLGLRWRRTPLSDRGIGLGLAWALSAAALAVGYFTWNNWP